MNHELVFRGAYELQNNCYKVKNRLGISTVGHSSVTACWSDSVLYMSLLCHKWWSHSMSFTALPFAAGV